MRARLSVVIPTGTAAALLTLAACSGGSADGVVELEFFQFKAEAFGTFNALVEEFNAAHPDIRVVQNQVADSETVIRTRLVRQDLPDVMTLNGNATYGEIAAAGVLYDFSGDPALEGVEPVILDILNDLGQHEGGTNAVPYASNANGVIYNKAVFAEHDLEPPTTWPEFLELCAALEAAGVQPFEFTFLDAWTTMPFFNTFAANLQPEGFFEDLAAEETSFQDAYPPVTDRIAELLEFANEDAGGRTYDDGNRAFATGEAAMMMHGNYALPAIRSLDPSLDLGMFALPTAEDPEDVELVSGVDVLLTMGAEPQHEEAALEFIRFLTEPENVARYADEQGAVPTVEGVEPTDPALEEVYPFFEAERVTAYVEHSIPPAVGLQPLTQQLVLTGDAERFLAELDEEWDKVAARSSAGDRSQG